VTWRFAFWNGWRFSLARLLEEKCTGTDDVGTLGNVLIIEDEAIIAEDLACIVEQLGLRVSGVAQTHEEAVALAKRAPLSLVLSDVRIADGGSGIEAVEAIRHEQNVAVVFITGCPYLVPPAFRESAFVVGKPYKEAAVKVAIEQAVSRFCDCPKLLPCACPSPQLLL
jgi:DNA-binding NtrC family response regulator